MSGAINETYFISHGMPTMAVDKTVPARQFMMDWRSKVDDRIPNAILIISAHWNTRDPTITAVDRCDTIHDFYGFPSPLYKLKYPAPGAPQLAKKVQQLLTQAGYKNVKVDTKRGLDHGAWIPLMLMYPNADIPVCQLSIQVNQDPVHHHNMGKAMSSLRQQGVLIIGSGSSTHPSSFGPEVQRACVEFDQWLERSLVGGSYADVIDYERKGPSAKVAHPRPDHFYPLHVAMGAAGVDNKAELIHRSKCSVGFTYSFYKFTTSG